MFAVAIFCNVYKPGITKPVPPLLDSLIKRFVEFLAFPPTESDKEKSCKDFAYVAKKSILVSEGESVVKP